MYCFMLSAFFTKSKNVAIIAMFMWLITCVPYYLTSHLSVGWQVISCVSPNAAMWHALYLMFNDLERIEAKEKWQQFHWYSMFVMIGSSIVYFLVTLYVEEINRDGNGMPKQWLFLFKKTFWSNEPLNSVEAQLCHNNAVNFQAGPHNRIAVRVIGLTKRIGKEELVKNVTFDLYDDQITVLLGHNGAGKSTAISMLTGLATPTAGTVIINGYDIRKTIKRALSSVGWCPQQNTLFDDLSVREHIEFFSRLKGVRSNDVNAEVNKYAKKLGLEQKINVRTKCLSGGMKRRLSLALAFCGNSKVVLCDEPTSGVDPVARRALWDLLQSEKTGRTILLTTHFLDEADVIGDRIAIMANGELKCYGTPSFLKKRFGSGYRLVCVKKDGCLSANVTKVLRDFIPEINIDEDIASELTYSLQPDDVDKFGPMFKCLEDNQDLLGLESFGVSLSTLEHVVTKAENDSKVTEDDSPTNDNISITSDDTDFILLTGCALHVNQWFAMLKKLFYYWTRSWISIILQNSAPVTLISLKIARHISSSNNQPSEVLLTSAMSFLPPFYTVYYTRERVSKTKLLQQISGMNMVSYWIISFLVDMLTFFLSAIVGLLMVICMGKDDWSTVDEKLLVFMEYGVATLPMAYALSFIFSTPASAFVLMLVLQLCQGNGISVECIKFILENSNRSINLLLLSCRHFDNGAQ